MNHIVPVKQFQTGAEMMAHYAMLNRKKRLYRPSVVLQIEAAHEPEKEAPKVTVSAAYDAAQKQRELDRRMFAAFDDYERQQSIQSNNREILNGIQEAIIRVPAEFIMKAVAAKYNVPVVDIRSQRRTRIVIIPRHEYCWLVQKLTTLSLPQIGKLAGKRDHTTVLSAIRRVNERIADRSEYGIELADFMQTIQSSYVESLSQ